MNTSSDPQNCGLQFNGEVTTVLRNVRAFNHCNGNITRSDTCNWEIVPLSELRAVLPLSVTLLKFPTSWKGLQ